MACPYMKTLDNISDFNTQCEKKLNEESAEAKKCPYMNKKDIKQEEKEDSDDEQPQGGCPVMNKGNRNFFKGFSSQERSC